MKVVILCGQDPLLFMLSSSPLPEVGEMDIAGGLRGEPIDVVRGPYTGFPIPADCEIAIEGETVPGQVKPEGPFGEWMGYYSDDTQARPYVNVKTILYRNDPILTCAPQHKPVDETGLLKGIAGAAQIWRALDACGVPEVLGVWNHEAGPATRFTAIQIKQRYPGHARQALHIAASCQGGAYAGKWTVVVDEDIDAGDLDQVLWAMCTRFDPLTDIDTIQKAWASKRDPLFLPGNFNNRILIDACIPYDKKLKGTFPITVDVSADLRKQLRAKFPQLFSKALIAMDARQSHAHHRRRSCGSVAFASGFRALDPCYAARGSHASIRAAALRCVAALPCTAPSVPRDRRISTRARPSPWSSATASAAATTPMARLLARHLGKHIPGNPSVVPQNMTGAGSLKAANYIYSAAPKDGTAIGTFSRSLGIAPLLDKAEFDSTKFTWLGSVTDEVSLCVTPAGRAGEDLERRAGDARRRSAARARAPIPTSSRCSTATCSAPRSRS